MQNVPYYNVIRYSNFCFMHLIKWFNWRQHHRICALGRTSENVSGEKGAKADISFRTAGTKFTIQFLLPFPIILLHTHNPAFPGYTYPLPRVLDNTCILRLFSFLHHFPMKILLFSLSDMTQGPQAGLINWSPWHLKRQHSPGIGNAGDEWSQGLRFPSALG